MLNAMRNKTVPSPEELLQLRQRETPAKGRQSNRYEWALSTAALFYTGEKYD